MWQVVCIGPGPLDRQRRIADRGPLHPNKDTATAFATYLRGTGLYESVKVVGTKVSDAALTSDATAGFAVDPEDLPVAPAVPASLDDLSNAFEA